jgi:hypothetical protein
MTSKVNNHSGLITDYDLKKNLRIDGGLKLL